LGSNNSVIFAEWRPMRYPAAAFHEPRFPVN
jgi:hypothetical protein